MSDLKEVKQAFLAPFQSAEVRVRTQPYVAAYATARVVMTRLDEALPWGWSFRLIGEGRLDANGVMHQDGEISVRIPTGSEDAFDFVHAVHADRGSAPPDVGKGQAKQAKHAVSDCFKRCAVHLGIGRYLYELQGVQAGTIPKASLEKALAAVGYVGAWDERHFGRIGGIREADDEDEAQDAADAEAAPGDGRTAVAAPTMASLQEVFKALALQSGFGNRAELDAWLLKQRVPATGRTPDDWARANAALAERAQARARIAAAEAAREAGGLDGASA